jgi:hypothetical protein
MTNHANKWREERAAVGREFTFAIHAGESHPDGPGESVHPAPALADLLRDLVRIVACLKRCRPGRFQPATFKQPQRTDPPPFIGTAP